MMRWPLMIASASLLTAFLAGCPLTTEVYLDNFPLDGEVVARNAAVWVDVQPHSARITDFGLYELAAGQTIPIVVSTYRDSDTNEYLFCPVNNLAPFTDYEVYMEINGTDVFIWDFRTDGSFDGSPNECYYISPWAADPKTNVASRFSSRRELHVRSRT